MQSTLIKQCFLTVVIASVAVSGKLVLGPSDFVTNFFGLIEPDQEPYVYSQIALEQIGDDAGLYNQTLVPRIMEEAKLLENPTVQALIKECDKYDKQPNCNVSLYRNYDGTCNNMNNPLWGSSNYMMDRYLPPAYEGISGFRKSVSGEELPNPRNISLKLIDKDNPTKHVSALFTFFGQFIAHDITSAPSVARNGQQIPCCEPSEVNDPSCAVVYFSKDDPFYKQFNFTCFPFTRTAPYPKGNFEKRNPMNKETSFIDASPLYGYNETIANNLRTKDGTGKLRSQHTIHGEILPANDVQNITFCPRRQTTNCFTAGDERVNQHATLSSLHVVFLRFHNNIADKLHAMNPKCGEERTYQETRRIVIGILQYIVYKEYLPWLIGSKLMRHYRLSVDEESLYDNEVNAGGMVEFTTGSFRLHSMVPKTVSKYQPNIRFDETYSNPSLIHEGKAESLVAGSCEVPSEKNDRYLKEDVDNYLYRPPGADFGTDLTVADVQRGRDHGLPPYVDVVRKCSNGRIKIRDFSDLNQVMPEANAKLLQSIYKNVSDIDLLIGIFTEKLNEYTVTGFTASCLSAEQFHRLKFGDSFFVTHTNSRYPFTNEQLKSIRGFSLAQLICQAGGFPSIRRYPLLLPSDNNDLVNCKSLPPLDLTPWKDPSSRDDSSSFRKG